MELIKASTPLEPLFPTTLYKQQKSYLMTQPPKVELEILDIPNAGTGSDEEKPEKYSGNIES